MLRVLEKMSIEGEIEIRDDGECPQFIIKTKEEIDFVLLDWKGIGNAEERERIIKILDKRIKNRC